MKAINFTSLVQQKINLISPGHLMLYSDFYDIADPNTIRMILKRLANANTIERVMDGIYVKPIFSSILKKAVLPSPVEVAYALARKFKWDIYPSGLTALNIVGLSTQIPNIYEFIGDGRFIKYQYQDAIISFKRSNSRMLKGFSKPLIILLIALMEYNQKNITDDDFKIIMTYARKHIKKTELTENTATLPEWLYILLGKIEEEY